MSTTTPTTPRRHAAHDSVGSTAAAQATRTSTTHLMAPSPHYTTSRRHSLYGTEDRIILDPGSRIWKVGFSGEGKPRDVFYPGGESGRPIWNLNRATSAATCEEEDRLLEARLQISLRSVFHECVHHYRILVRGLTRDILSIRSLLTDPKSRKVILIEHPLMPLHIKETFARILFNNLQVCAFSICS